MRHARILATILGLLTGSVIAATTVNIPVQVTATPTAATVSWAAGTATIPVATAPTPTPTPPPAGTAWGYYNGAWTWAGDFNNQATANYASTATPALSGSKVIAITLKAAWGEWLPYMSSSFSYPTTGYTKLTLALKPTQAGQKWNIYFVGIGDVDLHCGQDLLRYGPAPVVGQWGVYTVPLADLCVLGKNVYKFGLQDQTGKSVNTWYVDNAGFAP